MKLSISTEQKNHIFQDLRLANLAFQQLYPGDRIDRQPVHTVYGGAHLFKSDTALSLSRVALNTLQTYAPDFTVLAKAVGLPGHDLLPEKADEIEKLKQKMEKLPSSERKSHPAWLAYEVYQKAIQKLQREAVEDFRLRQSPG